MWELFITLHQAVAAVHFCKKKKRRKKVASIYIFVVQLISRKELTS